MAFFFLRINVSREVSSETINKDVCFMWVDCSGDQLLQSMEDMMAKIVVPALRSQEVRPNWCTCNRIHVLSARVLKCCSDLSMLKYTIIYIESVWIYVLCCIYRAWIKQSSATVISMSSWTLWRSSAGTWLGLKAKWKATWFWLIRNTRTFWMNWRLRQTTR